ncbi:LysM peptidoglycan-binding domain-containing protein [Bacillus sp. Bos-x628]|uniref:LysM peptidoglycan-binding domain-containing protein n=1 Tax=Bacillus maqinnsis TaxID=3229854 RepID=UPI00338DBC65
MEEMSRLKRKKEQLTKIHDNVEEKLEEEVNPSDDSHFPTREDFHEYKKQRTKKVRHPLFTTLAIIFPIIVIGVFFLLFYYTSEEIKHNNQDVYKIDKTSSADTDPVKSALVETNNDTSAGKTDAKDGQKKQDEKKAKEKHRMKEKTEQKKKEKAANEKREQEAAAKKREQQQIAAQKQQEKEKQREAEEKKKQENKPIRVVQHTVGPEETLYRISMKYYQNRSGEEKIRTYNHLNGNSVYSGQVLNIPLEN